MIRRPTSPSPNPTISRSTSSAAIEPITPAKRAKNPGLGAGRYGAGRRRLRKQTPIGRIGFAVGAPLVRADRRERAVEGSKRGGHQRPAGEVASVRDQITCGEIIGAIGDQIVAFDHRQGILCGEFHRALFDGDVGVEPVDQRRSAIDLRRADVGRGVDHLPLQVRSVTTSSSTTPRVPTPAAAR